MITKFIFQVHCFCLIIDQPTLFYMHLSKVNLSQSDGLATIDFRLSVLLSNF